MANQLLNMARAMSSQDFKARVRRLATRIELCLGANKGARLALAGIGKSHHIAQLGACTFSSLGVPCMPLDGAHLTHGDAGQLADYDVLILISKSGNTPELVAASKAIAFAKPGVIQILLTMSGTSLLDELSDDTFVLPPEAGEELTDFNSPTTSSVAFTWLLMELANWLCKVGAEGFAKLHPGGSIPGISAEAIDK